MGSCNVDKIANNVRLLAFLVSGISAFPVASACQVSSLCAKRSFPWRSAYQLHCSLIFIFIFMLLITGDSNVKSSVPILFHSMGQWVLGVCGRTVTAKRQNIHNHMHSHFRSHLFPVVGFLYRNTFICKPSFLWFLRFIPVSPRHSAVIITFLGGIYFIFSVWFFKNNFLTLVHICLG